MSRWDRIPTHGFGGNNLEEEAATVLMSRGSELMMRDLQERYQRVVGGDLPPSFGEDRENTGSFSDEAPVVDYIMLEEDPRLVATVSAPRRRIPDPPTWPTLDPPAPFDGPSRQATTPTKSLGQMSSVHASQPLPLALEVLHTEPTLDRQEVPPQQRERSRHDLDPFILLAFCFAGALGFSVLNLM